MSISAEEKVCYLREAAIVLAKEGFQLDEVHTDRLCILLDGSPLCEVTGSGGVAYRNEDIDEPERIAAKAWNAGELSSRVGLWGILKKVGYLVIVGVACVVDWLLRYGADSLGWDWPVDFLFASIVIIWLVINELLSILENVSAIGAPVPGFLQALLKKLKVHTEDTAEENLPGEENSDE